MTGNRQPCSYFRWMRVLAALALSGILSAQADETGAQPDPVIAIIIDDLGNHQVNDTLAIKLDGPVACAFLPHAPFTRALAGQAHAKRKEVMLHLPMQTIEPRPMSPGVLTMEMTRHQFQKTLKHDLASVPYVSGVNNHMGSLLTRHPGYMGWLMQSIRARGDLFFVDSRTSDGTVARKLAIETGVPNTRRDIFLDNEQDPDYIRSQFLKLLNKARSTGTALAIGHPHPQTMAVLSQMLGSLNEESVRMVSVSELIGIRNNGEPPWHASLSR